MWNRGTKPIDTSISLITHCALFNVIRACRGEDVTSLTANHSVSGSSPEDRISPISVQTRWGTLVKSRSPSRSLLCVKVLSCNVLTSAQQPNLSHSSEKIKLEYPVLKVVRSRILDATEGTTFGSPCSASPLSFSSPFGVRPRSLLGCVLCSSEIQFTGHF